VPLSYLYKDGAVYFHCASEGRKIDNLRGNNAATFTVVGATRPVYDKSFSTYYQSVIVSGTVREMTGDADKYRILYALAEKYLPGHMDKADDAIRKALARTAVYVLEPESVTGKAKRPQPVQS
jgi:nitroimidazol reductase NimA-like FMN-containing flavoprotein (pyridoxamine 5'-phosphate oxidase superfamily)